MIQERKPPRFKSDEKIQGLMMENETNIAKKKKKGKQLLLMDESLRKAFNANFGGLKHCRTKRNNTSKSLY